MFNYEVKNTDLGQSVTIQTKYDDMEVVVFPENCYKCPVGYHHGSECGRNVPWTDVDAQRRPDTCKLKQIDLNKLLGYKENSDEVDMVRFYKILSFLARMIDKLLYDTVIDSNERQQLQNIIDELPELKEDEFRW